VRRYEYQQRLQDAHSVGIFPAGEVTHVYVEHGPGCNHDQNRELPCICFPLMTVIVHGEVLTIGTGGAVLDRKKVA
jgi:hypothetical protein